MGRNNPAGRKGYSYPCSIRVSSVAYIRCNLPLRLPENAVSPVHGWNYGDPNAVDSQITNAARRICLFPPASAVIARGHYSCLARPFLLPSGIILHRHPQRGTMSSRSVRLAVMLLLIAGSALLYVHWRRSGRLHQRHVAENKMRPSPTPTAAIGKGRQPPARRKACRRRPPTRPRCAGPPPVEMQDLGAARHAASVGTSLLEQPSGKPADSEGYSVALPDPGPLSMPGIGELWTDVAPAEVNSPGDGNLPPFLRKNPSGEKLLTLSVNETLDIGPQCSVLKNDDTTFLARLGGGCCRQYPGPGDSKGVPEMLLGCQIEQQLTRHNKVVGALEYACDPIERWPSSRPGQGGVGSPSRFVEPAQSAHVGAGGVELCSDRRAGEECQLRPGSAMEILTMAQ